MNWKAFLTKKRSLIGPRGWHRIALGAWTIVGLLAVLIIKEPEAMAGGAQKLYAAFVDWEEMAAPSVSVAGHAKAYADSTAHEVKLSVNGDAYAEVRRGTVAIAKGGTNSTTALSGTSSMVSNGTSIIQGKTNFTGPTAIRAFSLPDAAAKILTDNAPVAPTEGGTGTGSYTLGDTLYSDGVNSLAKLGANTTATVKFLRSVSSGAPAWVQPTTSDLAWSGTSGGIPYFNSTTTINSSGVLASNAVVLGGGAGATPATLANGTAGQSLTMNAGATAPSWVSAKGFNENILINGGMDFAQRVTPATGLGNNTTSAYIFDRWKNKGETNAKTTISRTAATAGITASYAQLWTEDAASAQRNSMWQVLEYAGTKPLQSRVITFQVFMKASTATTMRMGVYEWTSTADSPTDPFGALSGSGTDPSANANWAPLTATNLSNTTIVSTNASCSVTTSWQNFAITVTVGSGSNNLAFVLFSNAPLATSQTVSFAQAGAYDGAGVRDWLPRPIQQELELCQRYYEKSTDIDTLASSATTDGCAYFQWGASTTGHIYIPTYFKVRKRAIPTVVLYDCSGTGTNVVRKGADGKAGGTVGLNTASFAGGTDDATSSPYVYYQWTADIDF